MPPPRISIISGHFYGFEIRHEVTSSGYYLFGLMSAQFYSAGSLYESQRSRFGDKQLTPSSVARSLHRIRPKPQQFLQPLYGWGT